MKVILLVSMNHQFSFSPFPWQKKKNIQNLIRATPFNQSYGHLIYLTLDLFISIYGQRANIRTPPSHLKFGHPNFEKREFRQFWVKTGKQEPLLMVYFPDENLSKQSEWTHFTNSSKKEESQLENNSQQ